MSNSNSGFCVPYTIRDTADKGRGVFADAAIPAGTILWRHVRGQYAVYDELSFKAFVATLSRSEVVYELEHMFGVPEFPGYVVRVFDDGAPINHSRQPNVSMTNGAGKNQISYDASPQNIRDVEDALLKDRFTLFASQDLKVGDELTMDYNIGIEEPAYYEALYEQYDISEPWL